MPKQSKSKLPAVSTQVTEARYCFLAQNISKAAKLHVSSAGRERCDPDYRVAREKFAGYAIEFVVAGRGMAVLDGQSWPLSPGTLFCYGPRTSHVITTDRAKPLTKFFVDFYGDEAPLLLKKTRLRPGRAVHTLELESFRLLFEAIILEGGKALPVSREICALHLRALMLKADETVSPALAHLSDAAANFQRCRHYIDTHFLALRSLQDIARGTHITSAYLCRLFQKFGPESPYQYLTRRKLNHAANLLVGKRCSVKAAAGEAGYADPYHFSRLFRSTFGQSPSGFTNRYRK